MEYGLIVKPHELQLLDNASIEYYAHDPMDFMQPNPPKEIEIDFESEKERNEALMLLRRYR